MKMRYIYVCVHILSTVYLSCEEYVQQQITSISTHLYLMCNTHTQVIHGDIKPENVMLEVGKSGGEDTHTPEIVVKLIDFGCACFLKHATGHETNIWDSYSSPEVTHFLVFPFNQPTTHICTYPVSTQSHYQHSLH
jgi:serine/threonine protein kinase